MRKTLLLTFCLCLLWGMGITAAASGPETRFNITISPPGGQHTTPALVTIRIEDMGGAGFEKARAPSWVLMGIGRILPQVSEITAGHTLRLPTVAGCMYPLPIMPG